MINKDIEDPILAYNFALEKEGFIEGFFMECSGLQAEREVDEYKEGGENSFIHKFPGRLKYSNVVLKRGITTSDKLWEWYQQGKDDGQVPRANVSIMLFNTKGETLKRWSLLDAFPVKWSGPDLKTDSNSVAIETIELIHHGLTVNK